MKSDLLKLIIYEPKGVLFEGDVESVSSTNDIGNFDILPEHEQFVSTISSFIVARGPSFAEKRWDIEGGIIRVKQNSIEVYVGI